MNLYVVRHRTFRKRSQSLDTFVIGAQDGAEAIALLRKVRGDAGEWTATPVPTGGHVAVGGASIHWADSTLYREG